MGNGVEGEKDCQAYGECNEVGCYLVLELSFYRSLNRIHNENENGAYY